MTLWPDPSKADRESLRVHLAALEARILSFETRLDGHSATIADLRKAGTPAEMNAVQGKIDALELWKAQIMGMLTEKSQAGRPRLTQAGRQLRGFYRG